MERHMGLFGRIMALFNMEDAEEKRLFELLKKAYVEARYNPNFLITREDCDFLFSKLRTLKDLTVEICTPSYEMV